MRVEAGDRLVEDQHRRVVQQGAREAELLLQALGQVDRAVAAAIAEPDQIEHRRHARAGIVDTVERREEAQILRTAHVAVEVLHLGHGADEAAGGPVAAPDRPAADLHGPGIGCRMPSSMRIVVVLPAPFGPRKP